MAVLALETCFLKDVRVSRSDGELVNAVLGGDRKAFATLVERYERAVRAVALSLVRDRHLAQDAAQEAFVRAYEKMGSLRTAGAFGSWLLRISRRCALDVMRQQRQRALPDSDFAQAESPAALDDDKERLLAAVVRLRPSEKQVVMLRYFDGLSVSEVADVVGRGVGTVTKQLSRAHRRLKALLKEA